MTKRATNRRNQAPAPEARTLFVVATAGLVVGLLAFVLGMNYGLGRTDSFQDQVSAGGVLERLDQQAELLRRVRSKDRATLSFHETLAGPARQPKKPKPKTVAIAKPAAKPKEKAVQETGQDKQEKAAQPEPKQPAAAPQQEEEPAAEDTDDGAGEEQPENESSHFSLQVGAFPDAGAAETLASKLTGKGYLVRIVSADVQGRGTWYRVRVGPYGDRGNAEEMRTKIAESEGLFALVVPERG